MKKNAALPIAPILALNIALMAACPLPAAPTDPLPTAPTAPTVPTAPTAGDATVPPNAISTWLATGPTAIGAVQLNLPTLTAIYQLNGQARLWTTEKGLSKKESSF